MQRADTAAPLTITVEQAGRLLGISRGLAYELVRRGDLPAVRLGRRLVVPRSALGDLLGERHPTDHQDLPSGRGRLEA